MMPCRQIFHDQLRREVADFLPHSLMSLNLVFIGAGMCYSILELRIWKCFVWLSDLGTSDDSSLSDSIVQDEGKTHEYIYHEYCSALSFMIRKS